MRATGRARSVTITSSPACTAAKWLLSQALLSSITATNTPEPRHYSKTLNLTPRVEDREAQGVDPLPRSGWIGFEPVDIPRAGERLKGDAVLQHQRTGGGRRPLLPAAARTGGPERDAHAARHQALLRAARAAADRQDLGAAGAARPAEQRSRGRLSLRVRQRGGGTGGARRQGRGDARQPLRVGAARAPDARRRVAGVPVAGCPGAGRPGRRAAGSADTVVGGRPHAPGAADRRNRHADRRHPDHGAAAVARRLRRAPDRLPAERDSVRGARRARRARLPHPLLDREERDHRRQRLQHQGGFPAAGRLHAGRGVRAARPAHRGDRAAVRRTGAAGGVEADRRPAVAGQRPGPGGVLRQRRGTRP